MSLVRQRPKTESTKHTADVNTEKDPFIYQIGKNQTVAEIKTHGRSKLMGVP